ncbi:MAG TPA: prolipoprotein diacylglyceryl transferase [Candidatus Moranbacteria bacterium]|nr:prolipoprotein diacylglyceryl transferase [Candidatus Moranbacteria bacterium]
MPNNYSIFWQNLQNYFDPIIFSWGFFSLHWYSLTYLTALLTVYLLLRYRIKNDYFYSKNILSVPLLDKLSLFLIIGVILGGRLGYVFFYELGYFIQHPVEIFWPFSQSKFIGISGMSFHGGLIGAILTGFWFSKKNNLSFLFLASFIIPAVPLGYFWGRLGNFLNSELYGRPTDSAIGMYFPTDQTHQLRHPSQLYEAIGEGILLFLILWPLRNSPKIKDSLLWIYLILYGFIRFFIEFFRQPDLQIGLLWLNLSLGQWLCLGIIAVGIMGMLKARNRS